MVCLCVQCICSCPVAYANGPSGAPAPGPMMDPSMMPEGMAGAMDSGADAGSSGSGSGSGCAPKPVPTQYEAFENVRFFWLELDVVLIVLLYMAFLLAAAMTFMAGAVLLQSHACRNIFTVVL